MTLRTAFIWDNPDQPLQVPREVTTLNWHVEDLCDKSSGEISAYLDDYLLRDRKEGFSLGDPPLMRFALFNIGKETYRWIWTFHHIICDGWSTTQIIHELTKLYQSLRQGLPVSHLRNGLSVITLHGISNRIFQVLSASGDMSSRE